MNRITPLFRALVPAFSSIPSSITSQIPRNAFSTSAAVAARAAKGKGGPKKDMRITLIRYHLLHPKTPRPLRLSRMRALRHWTIHRAWMLFRRQKAEREELVLQRQYQSMHAAVEELRTIQGPGEKDAGRLYRIAMEKKGIFGKDGLPIEYARAQTESPAHEAWNHSWTR